MGCGASSAKGKYAGDAAHTPVQELKVDAKQRQGVTSYRTTTQAERESAVGHASPPASPAQTEVVAGQKPTAAPLDAEGSTIEGEGSKSPVMRVEEIGAPNEPIAAGQWWASHAGWIQQRASEILAAYNFFFEHIGLRKGWRTAPFQKEEVQAPFQAAAEVVTVVRARLDEQGGGGMVLRQLEGASMSFLWGWDPGRPPGSSHGALEEFFRGLVFATLSDGRGLVEGLDNEVVEYYVSRHPIIAACRARAAADAPDSAPTAEVASSVPASPSATGAGADTSADGAAGGAHAVGVDGGVEGPCLATD